MFADAVAALWSLGRLGLSAGHRGRDRGSWVRSRQPDGIRRAHLCALGVACLVLANCSGPGGLSRIIDPRYGVSTSARIIPPGQPIPKGGGYYRVGQPYTIAGRTYVPAEDPHYRAEGVASWYGPDFHGRETANGEFFDMDSLSAAHTTLPLPSYVRVTNLSNGRSVIVRVNDRGPYHSDRVIDVSVRAATALGFYGSGLAPVRVEYVGAAPLEGSDDRMLLATLREGSPAPAPSLVRLASTKPFVPEASSRGVLRNVPVPQARPYSLGDKQTSYRPPAGPAGAPGPAGAVAALARAPKSDPDKAVASAPSPLSAYAPRQAEIERAELAPAWPASPRASPLGLY
jgi:rare lipoprotein A